MAVELRQARTAAELEEVFRLRHRVFAAEEGRLAAQPGGRLFDRFDTFETSASFLAYEGGEAAGSLRVTIDGPLGVPLDEHYDLRELRARCRGEGGRQGRTACVTSLCVRRDRRGVPRVVSGLFQVAVDHMRRAAAEHLIVIVNPDIEPLMGRLGLRPAGEPFLCPRVGQRLVPMHAPLADLAVQPPPDAAGLAGESWRFLQPGEPLFQAGEPAEQWYVVLFGEVSLSLPREGGAAVPVGAVGPGGLIGEASQGRYLHAATASGACGVRVVSDADLVSHAQGSPEALRGTLGQVIGRLGESGRAALAAARPPPGGIRLFNEYLAARGLLALEECGALARIEAAPATSAELAAALALAEPTLDALLRFLAERGVLERRGERFGLSAAIREGVRGEIGFLRWLVGGYAPVLEKMGGLLRGELAYGRDVRRNDPEMAVSAAAIGRGFTDAYLYPLLELAEVRRIADVGCGGADRLVEILQRMPDMRGVGVDLSPDCCRLARENAARAGLQSRLTIIQARAEAWLKGARAGGERPVDAVLCCGMFHDLMNAPGAAEAFLADVGAGLGPGGWLVIQDQMRLPDGEDEGRSWCRGFELVHRLMGQQLFRAEEYEALFRRAGLLVVRRQETGIPENWIYLLKT